MTGVFRLFFVLATAFIFTMASTVNGQEEPFFEQTPMTQQEHLNLKSLISPIPCRQPDGCPWSEGIGVFGYTDFLCVATYITFDGKPAILTAGHCLESEKKGDLINGFFHLPTVDKDNERLYTEDLELHRVERLFESHIHGIDITIISLKHAPLFHRPRSISKKAFAFNRNYSFIGKNFNPKFKNDFWSLQENCFNNTQNLLLRTDYRPTMQYLTNCHVGPGNSGAPIFDEDGDIVGVVRGFVDPQDLINFYLFAEENRFIKETEQVSSTPAYAYISLLNCLVDNFDLVDPNCKVRQRLNQVRVVKMAKNTLYTPKIYTPLYNRLDVLVPNCIDAENIKTSQDGQNFISLKIYHPKIDKNLNLKAGKKLESYVDVLLLGSDTPHTYLLPFNLKGIKRVFFEAQIPLCR